MEPETPLPTDRRAARRLIRLQDLIDLGLLATLVVPAWILPQSIWPRLSSALSVIHRKLRRRSLRKLDDALSLTRGPARSATEIEERFIANLYVATLQTLREYRPGGWKPELEIEGRHWLEEALARQKGAILWVYPFLFSDLVSKRVLFQTGYQVSHLSAESHGYSETRFGMYLLNPVRTRVENRYIGERILMGDGTLVGALRIVRERLANGGIVTITATPSGKRILEPRFLNGTLRLANGAPHLALRTGAALLPVFTVPDTSYRRFRTHVMAPLVCLGEASPRDAEKQLAQAYADALEPFVIAHPDVWPGWLGVSTWRPGR